MEASANIEVQTGRKVSVLIVDQTLDAVGVLANCAFVLGLSAGRMLGSDTFGREVVDGDGFRHHALTNIGHNVRKAGQAKLRKLREIFAAMPGMIVVDYTEDAAPADYEEYARNLMLHKGEQIRYRAIHIYGAEEEVVPLTKNLSRL